MSQVEFGLGMARLVSESRVLTGSLSAQPVARHWQTEWAVDSPSPGNYSQHPPWLRRDSLRRSLQEVPCSGCGQETWSEQHRPVSFALSWLSALGGQLGP